MFVFSVTITGNNSKEKQEKKIQVLGEFQWVRREEKLGIVGGEIEDKEGGK